MRRILTTATLLFLLTRSQAQKVIDVTTQDGTAATDNNANYAVAGQLYTGIKYVRVTAGTPFFKENFMKAVLFDGGGGRYRCNGVRINLLDNEINFLDPTGKELVSSSPIRSLALTDSVTKEKYLFVWGAQLSPDDKLLNRVWFQVLVNDETTLLGLIKKRVHEAPAYGTATTEQDIVTSESYYLHHNGVLTPVKGWQDLQDQLQDQKALLTQYIHDHKLKGKSADDYTQLVTAYNTARKS
jgi:hypothetical protein